PEFAAQAQRAVALARGRGAGRAILSTSAAQRYASTYVFPPMSSAQRITRMRDMTSASVSPSLPIMAARDVPAPIGTTADLRQALSPGRRFVWIACAIA